MRQGLTVAPAGLVLVLALIAAGPENPTAEPTRLDGHFGSRISPILLLDRNDVQRELHLDARQISEARTTIERLTKRVMTLKGKRGPTVEDDRRSIDEDSIRWIRDNLTEKQIERLTQVTFQWEGAAAMTRPHVIDRLELTDQQEKAIDQILVQLEDGAWRSPRHAGSGRNHEILEPSDRGPQSEPEGLLECPPRAAVPFHDPGSVP